MSKIWVIAYREYVAMVGTKAFIFSLVMMPILMFGSLLLMPALQKMGGGRELKILVADGTGKLFEDLRKASEQRNEAIKRAKEQPEPTASEEGFLQTNDYWLLEPAESPTLDDEHRKAISKRIKLGEIYALFEIPASLMNKPALEAGAMNLEADRCKKVE